MGKSAFCSFSKPPVLQILLKDRKKYFSKVKTGRSRKTPIVPYCVNGGFDFPKQRSSYSFLHLHLHLNNGQNVH